MFFIKEKTTTLTFLLLKHFLENYIFYAMD